MRKRPLDGLHFSYGNQRANHPPAQSSYELLQQEASRRGVEPDALADELLRSDLGASTGDMQRTLAGLAELRTRLPDIDGIALAREARSELEHRGA
jgi:hypothetical protein